MGKVLYMRKGETHTAPFAGIALADIAEGSVVKLNENGSPVEFYVAKHNYEPSLNGAGRTLLVRKDCYDERTWNASRVNSYAGSTIDVWLNGDYKAMLDPKVQAAIGETKFYHAPGNGDLTVTTLLRSVFLMSVVEGGGTNSYVKVTEGTILPIAETLKIAYYNGTAVDQWTRTPYSGTDSTNYLRSSGAANTSISSYNKYSRPVFTLPATAAFDEETLLFKGVP